MKNLKSYCLARIRRLKLHIANLGQLRQPSKERVEFIFSIENVGTRRPVYYTIVLGLESLKKTMLDLKIRGQAAKVADQDWRKRIYFKVVYITSC